MTFVNPLSPDSAIWHKMQLHAQYSVNLCEICATKRSWKDLHMEGIISCPTPIQDLIYHPCNFWNFLSLYFLGQVNIWQQPMHWELQIKLQFRDIPNLYKEQENFKHFYFFILGTCQFNLWPPPFLLVWFIAYPRKHLSNGISHVVSWFIVTDLEKFGISLGA